MLQNINNSTLSKHQRLVLQQAMTLGHHQPRHTRTRYQQQPHPFTLLVKQIMSALNTRVNIKKGTRQKTERGIPLMKVKDKNKIRRMDSIRETPSLDTCRGATVRELH